MKSYLSEEDKKGISQNLVYVMESHEADKVGDVESAIAWLQLVEIPAESLLALKHYGGADFIREMGLQTHTAEAVYGKDWLDSDL